MAFLRLLKASETEAVPASCCPTLGFALISEVLICIYASVRIIQAHIW